MKSIHYLYPETAICISGGKEVHELHHMMAVASSSSRKLCLMKTAHQKQITVGVFLVEEVRGCI